MSTVANKPGSLPGSESARKAVVAATKYLRDLIPGIALDGVSLEEIELSSDGRYWFVTLGFEDARLRNRAIPEFLRVPRQKLKVFKVSKATGRVLSMKMREV